MKTPKTREDCVIGATCVVNKTMATIVGYVEWDKLRYVWVKFGEVTELIKPQRVKLT